VDKKKVEEEEEEEADVYLLHCSLLSRWCLVRRQEVVNEILSTFVSVA
jgi:hypothetical protein